jgi:hypothetical protein
LAADRGIKKVFVVYSSVLQGGGIFPMLVPVQDEIGLTNCGLPPRSVTVENE